jgi:hypothetical protein
MSAMMGIIFSLHPGHRWAAEPCTSSINWIGTFRACLGYPIMPSLLSIYLERAVLQLATSQLLRHIGRHRQLRTLIFNGATHPQFSIPTLPVPGQLNYSGMKPGWTAGAGREWMFAENWSAKAEGLYYDLGYASLASSPGTTLCGAATCLPRWRNLWRWSFVRHRPLERYSGHKDKI